MPSINCRWNLVWKKILGKILGESDKNMKLRKKWGYDSSGTNTDWRLTYTGAGLSEAAQIYQYYGGLKFVPLGFKWLVNLQSVNKVKINLLSCFTGVRFAKEKHDYKFNFTLWTYCRITNLLNLRGTNFSPP